LEPGDLRNSSLWYNDCVKLIAARRQASVRAREVAVLRAGS